MAAIRGNATDTGASATTYHATIIASMHRTNFSHCRMINYTIIILNRRGTMKPMLPICRYQLHPIGGKIAFVPHTTQGQINSGKMSSCSFKPLKNHVCTPRNTRAKIYCQGSIEGYRASVTQTDQMMQIIYVCSLISSPERQKF